MPTYRLDLAYDGTDFHGYAIQRQVRTVQGALEAALARHTGPVRTAVAGRTDRGVHASGQVVSFVVDEPIDTDRVARSLNRQLGPEIAVTALSQAPDGFDARFSATSRRYRYTIANSAIHDPLAARTSWHVADRLDVDAMNRGVAALVGEHDFASFCRPAEGRTTDRRVLSARWTRTGDLVEFVIEAAAFCHQMVRSIVAVCVDVGRGRLEAESVAGILDARDRAAARGTAPPQGLVLVFVGYEGDAPGATPPRPDPTFGWP